TLPPPGPAFHSRHAGSLARHSSATPLEAARAHSLGALARQLACPIRPGWRAPEPLSGLYSKMSLRFFSNSALSISPLAKRSFRISIAREAVSPASGSLRTRHLGQQQQDSIAKSSKRWRNYVPFPPTVELVRKLGA